MFSLFRFLRGINGEFLVLAFTAYNRRQGQVSINDNNLPVRADAKVDTHVPQDAGLCGLGAFSSQSDDLLPVQDSHFIYYLWTLPYIGELILSIKRG